MRARKLAYIIMGQLVVWAVSAAVIGALLPFCIGLWCWTVLANHVRPSTEKDSVHQTDISTACRWGESSYLQLKVINALLIPFFICTKQSVRFVCAHDTSVVAYWFSRLVFVYAIYFHRRACCLFFSTRRFMLLYIHTLNSRHLNLSYRSLLRTIKLPTTL